MQGGLELFHPLVRLSAADIGKAQYIVQVWILRRQIQCLLCFKNGRVKSLKLKVQSSEQGMGPKVWGRLARRGKGALKDKKVVIWLMSARDLFNYRRPWKQSDLPE